MPMMTLKTSCSEFCHKVRNYLHIYVFSCPCYHYKQRYVENNIYIMLIIVIYSDIESLLEH